MTQNLPTQSKVANIRTMLERSRDQIKKALPAHLTADRLLRVAMTSIQKTPKLLDCTQQSLLACIMTCAQLGLEPDQFLGQAYLVPFKDTKKGVTICTLIPGYRGYIALARRSGEVQTVISHVVYERDTLELEYGVEDKLRHKPTMEGEPGNPIGAYCIFKYKDGSYSFDFMSVAEIEKIRARSKSANDGPWATDWGEMAKKTVIKRHSKLAPLSVEFAKAVALEDRAMSGESQADILGLESDEGIIEAESGPTEEEMLKTFADSIPKGTDMAILDEFIKRNAEKNKTSPDAVKIEAVKRQKEFWQFYGAYQKTAKAKAQPKEAQPQPPEPDVPASVEQEPPEQAPVRFACPDGGWVTDAVCRDCKKREGCPVRG
jgi:recombination protein RecT